MVPLICFPSSPLKDPLFFSLLSLEVHTNDSDGAHGSDGRGGVEGEVDWDTCCNSH